MRQPFDYLDQLKKDFPEDYLDSIQYELDKIYYYGNQFKKNTERKTYETFLFYRKNKLVDVYKYWKSIRHSINKGEKYAVSNAYFGLGNLNELGIKTQTTPWLGIQACTWKQYKLLRNYQDYLSKSTLFELLSGRALAKQAPN